CTRLLMCICLHECTIVYSADGAYSAEQKRSERVGDPQIPQIHADTRNLLSVLSVLSVDEESLLRFISAQSSENRVDQEQSHGAAETVDGVVVFCAGGDDTRATGGYSSRNRLCRHRAGPT